MKRTIVVITNFTLSIQQLGTCPDHLTPKLSLTAIPNLSMAWNILSSEAAAYVTRKNISVGSKLGTLSPRNQLPLPTSTPWPTAAKKISSSISRTRLVLACGCFCQSTESHSWTMLAVTQVVMAILTNMPAAGGFQLTRSLGKNFSHAARMVSLRFV